MASIAALTMVRDDAFFLRVWLRHYGGLLGPENCYVINHGGGAEMAAIAAACNVIAVPDGMGGHFDARRWRLMNHICAGLRGYHDWVIVGDVDEVVIADPAGGRDLPGILATAPRRSVLTPLGVEVLHLPERESEPLDADKPLLGPRGAIRAAPHYSKPCIVGASTKIARGGHYTKYPMLHCPDDLLLVHLKYCDLGVYSRVQDRRNCLAQPGGKSAAAAGIGGHWFAAARGDDRALFDGFTALRETPFDPGSLRAGMRRTWRPRGDTGYWHFDRPRVFARHALPPGLVGAL